MLEGVAFSVRLNLGALQAGGRRPERFVAAGGGARSALWLRIKASMYGVPYLVPRELECGVVGAAAMMAAAVGDAPDLAAAVGRMVAFERRGRARPGLGDALRPDDAGLRAALPRRPSRSTPTSTRSPRRSALSERRR